MTNYLYNARDVAAYFKWVGVSSHMEKQYIEYIFKIGKKILAKPLTIQYESFEQAVYRELYFLWSDGFENEYSDIANVAPKGAVSLICDQEFINLESYMKLIALHLLFSRNLPYVRVNFIGLPFSLGIKGEFSDFEENVVKACETLHLTTADVFGNAFDLTKGIPDEVLCVSLQRDFRLSLAGEDDFRKQMMKSAELKMKQWKESSRAIIDEEEKKKKMKALAESLMSEGKAEASSVSGKKPTSKKTKKAVSESVTVAKPATAKAQAKVSSSKGAPQSVRDAEAKKAKTTKAAAKKAIKATSKASPEKVLEVSKSATPKATKPAAPKTTKATTQKTKKTSSSKKTITTGDD